MQKKNNDDFVIPQAPSLDRAVIGEWLEHFPELSGLDDPVWQKVLDSARPVVIPRPVCFRADRAAVSSP